MPNISSEIKAIQDIMRKDTGVDGDAQRLSQIVWMLFLKIFADKEDEAEVMKDDYKSPLEEKYRWQNWAKDDEGVLGYKGDSRVTIYQKYDINAIKRMKFG